MLLLLYSRWNLSTNFALVLFPKQGSAFSTLLTLSYCLLSLALSLHNSKIEEGIMEWLFHVIHLFRGSIRAFNFQWFWLMCLS